MFFLTFPSTNNRTRWRSRGRGSMFDAMVGGLTRWARHDAPTPEEIRSCPLSLR
jgi:hypothetical protein